MFKGSCRENRKTKNKKMSIKDILGSVGDVGNIKRKLQITDDSKKEGSVFDSVSLKEMRAKQQRQSGYPKLLEYWLKKIPKADLILDLGCSLGDTTMWLNEHRGQTVGVDDCPIMVKQAKELHGYEHFYLDNFTRLNFKAKNFDIVFSYDSLKKAPNIVQAMAEIYRVSKGVFFCVMPLYGLGLGDMDIYSWQPNSREEIENLISSVGFKIEESEQIDVLEKTGTVNMQSKNQLVFIKGRKQISD